jgi:O-antigen/teichoic acid export membrane protein
MTAVSDRSSMKTVFASMVYHGSFYWLAIVIGRVSGVLLLPIYTRYLTTADYGIMELLDLTCSVAMAIIGMRLADSMLCHYFDAPTEAGRNAALSTALLGSVLVGGAAVAAGWFAAPLVSRLVFSTPVYAHYFQLVFLSVGLSLPQAMGYAYLRAQNRSTLFLAASTARLLLQIGLMLWLLVWRHMGFAAMIWTALIGYSVEAPLACWYILRRTGFTFDWRLFRRLGSFGGPLAVGSACMLFIHYGDRYVLSRYVSLSEIGIYALGYKIGMLVAYAQGGFAQYWGAQMYPILQREDGGKLYVRISTYYAVASIFIALALSVFGHPVLEIMVPGPYRPAAAFVPVIAVAYVLRGLGDHLRTVFFVERRTKLDAVVICWGTLVCVILYIVLIPRMGLWGAASATVIAFGVMVPLSFWWAQKIRRYSFEWSRIGVASVCAAGLYAVDQMLIVRRPGPDLLVAALCCLAFPVLLVSVRFFDSAEELVVRQTWITIVRRFKSVPQGCSGR